MVFSLSRIAASLAAVCLSSGMIFLSGCDDCDEDCPDRQVSYVESHESCPAATSVEYRSVSSQPVQAYESVQTAQPMDRQMDHQTYHQRSSSFQQQPTAQYGSSGAQFQPQSTQYDASGAQYQPRSTQYDASGTHYHSGTGESVRSSTSETIRSTTTDPAGSAVRSAGDAGSGAVRGAQETGSSIQRGMGF
jgi:hypothetical protein